MQQEITRSGGSGARGNLIEAIHLIEMSSEFIAGAMMAFDSLDKGTRGPLVLICNESMERLDKARELLAVDL